MLLRTNRITSNTERDISPGAAECGPRQVGVTDARMRHAGVPIEASLKGVAGMVARALVPPVARNTHDAGAVRAHAAEATVTIMFTDIVGSGTMTERLGDQRAREVFRRHNDIISRHTRAQGGTVVKSMGDGFMLTFSSAHRAVGCAVAAQRDLSAHNKAHPDTQLAVRMGMSIGEPIREQQDLFGKSVIQAARISARAEGGQVLTCQIVHALAADTGEFVFREIGAFELKGISGTHTLYEVLWR